MRLTTLCPPNDAATALKVGRPVPDIAGMRHLHVTHVATRILGLLLFAPVATFALEIGEASIKSGLGQSLVVEIPYRLASDERLSATCIALIPAAQAADALPTYTQVRRISLTSTHIEIFDDKSVREPLIGLNLSIHCATAPHFVRSYQLFVDPPVRMPLSLPNGAAVAGTRSQSAIDAATPRPDTTDRAPSASATATATTGPSASASTATATRANPSPRARGQTGGDLTQGQSYRVVSGDTLSGIAARVAARPATIRATAEAIFAANPEAFTRGNPDLIKAGRSIAIPIMTPAPAAPAVLTTPAPLPANREVEAPAVAVATTAALAPALPIAPQPLPADDTASVVSPAAIEPPRASAAVVTPRADPVPAPTRTDLATEASSGATSSWLIALLALGVVCLLSAPLAFLHRRKQQDRVEVQKQSPRRLIEPIAGIEVIEGRLPRAHSDDTAQMSGARVAPATDAGLLPADLKDLALTLSPTDPVDLNVGAPVVMSERVDWFAAGATAPVIDAAVGEETIEENAATAQMPTPDAAVASPAQLPNAETHGRDAPVDDEQMTLTIVEIDMLREDYEAQHTLTQHTSQALYDALAALNATKAARAAAAANSTLELPQQSEVETTDSTERLPTARVRTK